MSIELNHDKNMRFIIIISGIMLKNTIKFYNASICFYKTYPITVFAIIKTSRNFRICSKNITTPSTQVSQ